MPTHRSQGCEEHGEYARSVELALLRQELAQPLTHLTTALDIVATRLRLALDEDDSARLRALAEPLAAARETAAHLIAVVRGWRAA